MTSKELNKKIAEALGWTELHWKELEQWSDGHGASLTSPRGWYGKGPGDQSYFSMDSTLLNAWYAEDYTSLRTILEVVEANR